MRRLFILFFILCVSKTYAQSDQITKIEFQSLSRGYLEKVIITPDSVILVEGLPRETKTHSTRRPLQKKEWRALVKDFSKIEISEIPSLQSPTMKRTFDGARHSMIRVHIGANQFDHSFDNEKPNSMLSQVMKCILAIKEKSY